VAHRDHAGVLTDSFLQVVQGFLVEDFVDMQHHFVKTFLHHDLLDVACCHSQASRTARRIADGQF
jgi:hypothetical protein